MLHFHGWDQLSVSTAAPSSRGIAKLVQRRPPRGAGRLRSEALTAHSGTSLTFRYEKRREATWSDTARSGQSQKRYDSSYLQLGASGLDGRRRARNLVVREYSI